MDRLIDGFRRFRQDYWRDNREIFEALATRGQSPRAMVIACSDSRVDPQMIFQTVPGEIFVVRNVANLVPPYAPDAAYHGTSAAVEFAVRALQVQHIVVLGHSGCGGVDALLRGERDADDFVTSWMDIAAPARERARRAALAADDTHRLCEHEAIKVSLTNLNSFPWVRERTESGKLALHGWHFDIEQGDLRRLDDTGSFRSV
ncbi:MAG TPA: carbonic anhydrase [Stellaceae bacterium]